ncbi:MAG: hypothetical protein ACLP6G_11220 [Terriglobales bacterium]
MRTFAALVCLTAACFGQATQHPAAELQFTATDYGRHFFYSIPHPERVRKAWIEVRDRPLLIAKKPVAVEATGTLDWDWDRSALNVYEQPEDNLGVSIWDPNGETMTCDINAMMTSQPGGIVAWATVGSRQQFMPSAHLNSSWVRSVQGSPAITFDVTGKDLSPSVKFRIDTSRSDRCKQQSLHARVLDLAHARITLGADCLQKAGIFLITTEGFTLEGATLHVASRTSPQLNLVTPSSLPDDFRQDKLKLVLRGRGFTKDSVVYAGYNPDANDFQKDQLWPDTEYVSSTELRVHVDPVHAGDYTVAQPAGEKLRLWVVGNEEKFELSQPLDVTLQPTGHPLPSGRLSEADFRRWKPKTAIITSVSPFPIRLMNEHSPKELEVTIRGENFSPEDKVSFSFGDNVNNDKEVQSEYVSPTTLRAWLPRQSWRKHALTYRLVVETTTGQRYTRQVDEKGDE